MFDGIMAVRRHAGLEPTGEINPGDETEDVIRQLVSDKTNENNVADLGVESTNQSGADVLNWTRRPEKVIMEL